MKQKRILITGASSGIGNNLFKHFTEQAHEVYALCRSKPRDWEYIPSEQWSSNQYWINIDLDDPDHLESSFTSHFSDNVPDFDAVIFCAVYYGEKRKPLWETNLQEWKSIINVNGLSNVILTKLLIKCNDKCPIIFSLSSEVVTNPAPGRIAYACSKSFLSCLYRNLPLELLSQDCTCFDLLPEKWVLTPGIKKRRPIDFHYTDQYAPPTIFNNVIDSLLQDNSSYRGYSRLIVSSNGKIINGMAR